MNLKTILSRRKDGVDPIPMDSASQCRFNSWSEGFDAYEKGWPLEGNNAFGRSKSGWAEGWLAAKRMAELAAEKTNGL